MTIDNYRYAEVPRIVNTDAKVYRILQGLRGSWGDNWDWDTAILYNKAERNDVTSNRISNNLMQEALSDPTPAAYNPWGAGDPERTNIDRALVDVRRDSETDLFLVDFKISSADLFDVWGGPVGMLAGAEYRKESFKDDRDDRLDGTITFTDWEGDTYPFVSDVVNSSPTPDSSGDRSVTSLFAELAVPLFSTLDLQFALRYENFSDVGSTTVPKIAFGWRPTEWFLLRGSWSEAFRAPNLVTINESLVVRNNTRTDYLCQYAADFGGDPDQDVLDCRNTIQRRAFGSKDLKPEKSDNYSIGTVLTPIPNLTMTIDFWKIEKKDTIGLFGEENHTLYDLLLRLEGGPGDCTGNTAVGRDPVDEEYIPYYEAVGLCPAGDMDFVNDQYANLDTRIVQGIDFGLYYDVSTGWGDWSFNWLGSIYTVYDQEPGGKAQELLRAQEDGIIPSNYPVTGFADILRQDGNQEQKMNARLNWRKNDWGASLSWLYLSDFIQTSLERSDGTQWVIPSHSTFNATVDYRFNLWGSVTRARFGIRNLTDERAPLADRYFGYFSDAHSDLGRAYYLDIRMAW
jgi:outer membrane receptor protein involved in Fe transport